MHAYISTVVEQLAHQSFVVFALEREDVISILRLPAHHVCPKHRILEVHVGHVVCRSIHVYLQLGIEHQHLLQCSTHGEDAAYLRRAACLDVGITLEDLRETRHHSTCYAMLLLVAQFRQVTIAQGGTFAQHHDLPISLTA